MKKAHDLGLKPIGTIHSPYKNRTNAPRQGHGTKRISLIEVFEEFEEGLQDIDGFSHIIVVYWFHKSRGYHLLTKTPWDNVPHGVFSTRSPHRPNRLALTVVELVVRKKNILKVKGLDAIDGTPLLDIKPYIHELDQRSTAKSGWLENKPRMGRC